MNSRNFLILSAIFIAMSLLFSCSGADGSDGLPGLQGESGTDGATPLCDADTKTWHVGGTDTGIKCFGADGQSGDDGKGGSNGTDGDTPRCDSETGTWHIGVNDTKIKCLGLDGQAGDKGDDGDDGESCSVGDDPEDSAWLEMTCAGTSTSVRWPKAMCGSSAYDPEKSFCHRGSVAPLCAGESYNASSHFCDVRDDRLYKYVKIGEQVWMAENLRYNALGSKCGDDDNQLKDVNTSTCDTYGRLYDWATAVALAASCNAGDCASQVQAKHQGVCPSGWHLPSDGEWDDLMDAVGGASTAGTELKSETGWYDEDIYYKPSTDDFGFSALPGGYGGTDGSFSNVGDGGYWWSATEIGASNAWSRYMGYDDENVYGNYDVKSALISVRCLRD
ncbi:MAG: hypothetical protein FWH22_06425 [Fibromonadales bacterium]|nr:hypothetical protein [Fibromonadales bacterium]